MYVAYSVLFQRVHNGGIDLLAPALSYKGNGGGVPFS